MPGYEKLPLLQRDHHEDTNTTDEADQIVETGGLVNNTVTEKGVDECVDGASLASQNPGLKFLIYGRTGWIGGLLGKICEKQGISYEYGSGRLENRSQLEADIATVEPTHVFNAAGVTGRPNVDWCESHKVETIRANVVGTLTLADVCKQKNLLLVNFATGCIFEYDEAHPLGSGIGFVEEDKPNFHGSYYSKTKAMVNLPDPLHVNLYSVLLSISLSPSLNVKENKPNFQGSCYSKTKGSTLFDSVLFTICSVSSLNVEEGKYYLHASY